MCKYGDAIQLVENATFGMGLYDEEVYSFEEIQIHAREELGHCWLNLDDPHSVADKMDWLEVFYLANLDVDLSSEATDGKVTLYRASQPSGKNNLSWTTSLEVAKWFNDRNHEYGFDTSVVYELTIDLDVHARRLLAHFKELGEEEVVIDVNRFSDEMKEVDDSKLANVEGKLFKNEAIFV